MLTVKKDVRYCVAMNRQECLFYRRSDIPVWLFGGCK